MSSKNFILLIIVGLLIVSCSKKSTNPVPATSPGTGSYSLFVQAEVNGIDEGGGVFTTDFFVLVRDTLGVPVNNAQVTFTHSQLGTLSIPLDVANPGEYNMTRSGYVFGSYTLNVVRGNDRISNARIFAPEIHQILDPTTADTLKQDSSFTAVWSRTYVANLTEIETRDFGPTNTVDDGNFVVPASFQPRTDQRVRIKRQNSVSLAGGIPGSSLEASIRNTAEPIVVQ